MKIFECLSVYPGLPLERKKKRGRTPLFMDFMQSLFFDRLENKDIASRAV
jgi:hypothetical protein